MASTCAANDVHAYRLQRRKPIGQKVGSARRAGSRVRLGGRAWPRCVYAPLPAGATLTRSRRLPLLGWALRNGAGRLDRRSTYPLSGEPGLSGSAFYLVVTSWFSKGLGDLRRSKRRSLCARFESRWYGRRASVAPLWAITVIPCCTTAPAKPW